MKRILFPTLLIATLLAGGLVAFAIWRTSPASAEDYVKSAKELMAAKPQPKLEEATIQLLNALKADDRNRDARMLLAQSYLFQNDPVAAAKQLRTLLDYFPNDKQANIMLGSIYVQWGGPQEKQEAKKIAESILKAGSDTQDPANKNGITAPDTNEKIATLTLLGNASASLNDYDGAVKAFEEILNLDPKNIGAYISLGTVHVVRKSNAEAEKAFLAARDLDPKNRAALLALGNYYYRVAKDTKKAEEVYKSALVVFPNDPLVYSPLAGIYNDTGRFDEAVRQFTDIQAKDTKNIVPSLALSDLLVLRHQEADALRVLLDAKKNNPDNLDLAAKIASLVMKSDPKLAREQIDQILKTAPKSSIGLVLLGENQFWTGDLEGAKKTLNESPALNSPFPEAHYFLGAIDVRGGQLDSAEDHYRKALALNANYLIARSALAGVLLDKGRATDARVEIAHVLEADPNNVPGRLLKTALDMKEQRYEGIEQELNAIAKLEPSNPEIQRQMAVYYATRGRNADAEKSYIHALELQPNSIEYLQALIQFYSQTKQYDKGLQKLVSIPDGQKKPVHYEMIGTLYTQLGKNQEAEAAFTKAIELDPKSNADAAIASMYIRNGRMDEGLRKLDELIKKNPGNAGAYAIKGIIYENQGKTAEAKESYTKALQLDGTSDVAANNLAYLLAEQNQDLETALTWASTARKRQPNFPGIADTLGWVYYKMGSHVLARDQLQFAASKEPNNPVFQYHLGMIYIGNKQIKEAGDALRKAVNSPTDFKEKPLAQAALKDLTK